MIERVVTAWDRFVAWRAHRRHLAHKRWLKRNRVFVKPAPWDGAIVRNIREPNSARTPRTTRQ